MIGSLLFYVLYPFSRYLTSRPSAVNGTAVWDGGGVTTKTFTQSETTPLDLWLSPNSDSKGQTKERVKKSNSEKEDVTRPDVDKELLMAVLHNTKNDTALKMCEVQSEVEEIKTENRHGPQQEKAEIPSMQDGEITIHYSVPNWKQENGHISPTEDINPEQTLGEQLKSLQTEDNTQESSCLVQEQTQIQASEESVVIADISTTETTWSAKGQIQIPHKKKSHSPAEVTECWDEYVVPAADETCNGANNSKMIFASLLSNAWTDLDLSRQNDAQTAWHFPAGPGLAEEVQCPPWDYPAMSYYPSTEPTMPFEVMWRVWEDLDDGATTAEAALIPFPLTKATMDFTVMSYNILAQDLLELHQDLYTHCPLEVLDWNYRFSLLVGEIQKWTPDIVCLQEVQENHYHEQLHPFLSEMGYTCVYKRRTGTKTDGCATCYRSSCFSQVVVTELEFFRPETELLDRHNVGIVLLLRPVVAQGSEVKGKAPPLCVANTHLLFNPKRGDVKLAQLAIMLAEISSVVKSCKAKGEHCNVVLCGDFNSVPHMFLYQLITTGELYYQGLPAWMISGQEDLSYKVGCYRLFAPLWPSSLGITDDCQYTTVNTMLDSQSPKSGKCQYSHDFMLQLRYCPAACVRPQYLKMIPGVTDNTPDASEGNQPYEKSFRHTISHGLDLESVYKHILPGPGCPEVTTLHSEGGNTVDYIFYSPKRSFTSDEKAGAEFASEGLKLISSLSLLSEDVLWSMHGLPNHIFPSDHLSLVAKFQLDVNTA
ncbi:protein angel homolog 1 isoform X2 [Amphiprion ocellaris]|uniref:protein angel homolog 1 isoform X2 n=1 Tax=Amphiprion ocellaris TaxID=80972 RepID=UPI002410E3DA|nr:protein angel homolog 1 isoform X2 [Amphiprion ocellaris]